MEQWVATYKAEGKRNPVTLRVHPFTAAYLNHKLPAQPTRWFLKYRVRIHVETDGGLDPLTYHFIDAQSGQDITEASTNGTDSGTQKKSGKPAS